MGHVQEKGPKVGNSDQDNLSVIIVEVLGYGGGDNVPDDQSRLKPDQRTYNAAGFDPDCRLRSAWPAGAFPVRNRPVDQSRKHLHFVRRGAPFRRGKLQCTLKLLI